LALEPGRRRRSVVAAPSDSDAIRTRDVGRATAGAT